MLQVFYDIEQEKQKNAKQPNLNKLRPVLFWDTTIENINWQKQKIAVIQRVFERGNETEKNEIYRFYGKKNVNQRRIQVINATFCPLFLIVCK